MSMKCDICGTEGNRETIMGVVLSVSTAPSGVPAPERPSIILFDADLCGDCVRAIGDKRLLASLLTSVAKARGVEGFHVAEPEPATPPNETTTSGAEPAQQGACLGCGAEMGTNHHGNCPAWGGKFTKTSCPSCGVCEGYGHLKHCKKLSKSIGENPPCPDAVPPEPPPQRVSPYKKCIKCGTRTCREGYDRDDPFLCNTCYELMPDKPWLDIDFLEGECVCGCDGYFSEHAESCEHMAQVRAWRAVVLALVTSSMSDVKMSETAEAPPKPDEEETPRPSTGKDVPPGVCWACEARDGEVHRNWCPLLRLLGVSELVFHHMPDDVYDKLHPPDGKPFCAIRKCMQPAADKSFYCVQHEEEACREARTSSCPWCGMRVGEPHAGNCSRGPGFVAKLVDECVLCGAASGTPHTRQCKGPMAPPYSPEHRYGKTSLPFPPCKICGSKAGKTHDPGCRVPLKHAN